MSVDTTVFAQAQRHLSRRDPVLKRLIRAVGPCTLTYRRDRFGSLVRSIISQQISTKAAAAITGRLEQTLKEAGIVPSAILGLSPEGFRAAGLSAAKVRALCDLAEKVQDQTVPLKRLHRLPDEEVIARLVHVRGIGRWTAEMFLIFSLGRLDVLPVDDWGLRSAVRKQFELNEAPGKTVLTELAEPWRPYRSVATWYLWRSLGFVPQSKIK
jgi:DNA-3-methyladenine glycosylase II